MKSSFLPRHPFRAGLCLAPVRLLFALLLIGPGLLPRPATALELVSEARRLPTVELYTSEGCDSCPQADAWLAAFAAEEGVFNKLLPLAFHVDYWDMLGWKDRFAKPEHSQRQRLWGVQGRLSQVYTPAVLASNREWRGWYRQQPLPVIGDFVPGVLKVVWPGTDKPMLVSFRPQRSALEQPEVHVALLGMGLSTEVRAGENRGKTLPHEFVVLAHQIFSVADTRPGQPFAVKIMPPALPRQGQQRTAVAVWLAERNYNEIVQAVAGFID